MMLGGDQPRIHGDAAPADFDIVKAAAESRSPHLEDAQAPPLRAILHGDLLHPDDAMADRMQIEIVAFRGEVVQQENGAKVLGEIMLEGQNLPPIAER